MTNIDTLQYTIASAGKVLCRPDWVWNCRPSRFNDFDLWCVFGGHGKMVTGNKTYELSAGDFFLLYPGIVFYAENDPEDPLTVVYVHFDFFRNGKKIVLLKNSPLPCFYRKMPDILFFNSLLQRMLEHWHRNKPQQAELWLAAALDEIANSPKNYNNQLKGNALSEASMKLYRHINEHPEQKYSLRKIARKHGACPEHFSRTFTKAAGCSFRNAVTGAKLKRAKLLLSSTNYSITEISKILGFGSVYHFSKLFKKRTGLPPSELRKSS